MSTFSTVGDALRDAAEGIRRSPAIDHWKPVMARYDAEELMAAVLGDAIDGPTRRRPLGTAQRRRFNAMVARRIAGEPVAQIVGFIRFRGLELAVRPEVFGPRASSELLAAEAVSALRRRRGARTAVDVATGAGPVAIAVAHEVPNADVWGVDISARAVTLARANARKNGVGNVRFRAGDMLTPLPSSLRGKVTVFTIHPPYVARAEVRTLPREIREFEPLHSLSDGSDDGLGLVRRLAEDAPQWLASGGLVMVEVGAYLARRAQSVLRRAGFSDVKSARDALGVTRVVSGRFRSAQ